MLFRSGNPEEIGKGAESIKAFFEKMKAAHEADKEAAIKEALAQAGAQPKPKGGSDTMTEITRESLKTPEGRRAMLEKAKVSGGAIPIVE